MKKAKEICPTTTMGKVQEGALLIDVREPNELKELAFDVLNIMNIPLSDFGNRFQEIPKDKEIVMVCRSGQRSLRTTYFLMNAGFEKVYNMEGGILKWASKGLPTKGDVDGLLNTVSCDCSQPNCC